AGTAVVDVNLERVRYLRATRDQVGSSETCAAKQGVLGPQWQRPELYDRIYPRPLREAAEEDLASGTPSHEHQRTTVTIGAAHGPDRDAGNVDRRVRLSRSPFRCPRRGLGERIRHRADARDLLATPPYFAAGAVFRRRLQRHLRWPRHQQL